MSKYLRAIVKDYSFDGDSVKATFKPMDAPDFMSLGRAGNEAVADEQIAVKRSYELVSKYLVKVEGLTDSAGAELTRDDVVRDSYFVGLVTDIFKDMVELATPSNPKGPSAQ